MNLEKKLSDSIMIIISEAKHKSKYEKGLKILTVK